MAYYPVSSRTRDLPQLGATAPFSSDTGAVTPYDPIPSTGRGRSSSRGSSGRGRSRNVEGFRGIGDKPLSQLQRAKNAESAIDRKYDIVTDDPAVQEDFLHPEKGEVHNQYLARWDIMQNQLLPRHIGLNRSENLSKVIMNQVKYGVRYSPYTQDVLDRALQE